jgi:hypothetical protein
VTRGWGLGPPEPPPGVRPWPGVQDDYRFADTSGMSLRWFVVFALVPMAAACGQGGAAAQSSSHHVVAATPASAGASRDVLRLDDLGNGWMIDFSHTGTLSLNESMKGDSPATKTIERRSYRSGYHTVFAGTSGYDVYSVATTYATAHDARAVAAGWAQTASAQMLTSRRISLTGAALGDQVTAWQMTLKSQGRATPGYIVEWVRGRVIAAVSALGRVGTVADLTRLAKLQDARLSGRPMSTPPGGEQAKSATAIIRDATAAVDAARSVHLVEHTPGQQLDFHAGVHVGAGSVRTPFGLMRARRVGRRIWFAGNRGFYLHAGGAAAAGRAAGRWLSMPPSNPGYVGVANLTSTGFVARMMAPATAGGALRKAGTAFLDHTLTIVIQVKKADGTASVVFISARGTPYPLRIDQPSTSGGVGEVMLSAWNRPITVRAPAHTIDLSATDCPCT